MSMDEYYLSGTAQCPSLADVREKGSRVQADPSNTSRVSVLLKIVYLKLNY